MLDLVIKLLSQMEVCMILSDSKQFVHLFFPDFEKENVFLFLAEKCFFLQLYLFTVTCLCVSELGVVCNTSALATNGFATCMHFL